MIVIMMMMTFNTFPTFEPLEEILGWDLVNVAILWHIFCLTNVMVTFSIPKNITRKVYGKDKEKI